MPGSQPDGRCTTASAHVAALSRVWMVGPPPASLGSPSPATIVVALACWIAPARELGGLIDGACRTHIASPCEQRCLCWSREKALDVGMQA